MPQLGEYKGDGSKTRWAGPNYGYQSEASYSKLEKEDSFERPVWWNFLTPDGLSNTFEYLGKQEKRINERTGYKGPAMGPLGIPLPLSVYEPENGESTVTAGNVTPVVQQMTYGGTVGVAKNLLELGAAAAKATAPFVEGRSITDPVDPYESRGMGMVEALDEGMRSAPGLEQDYDRPPEDRVFEYLGGDITTGIVGGLAAGRLIGKTAFTTGAFARLSPALQKGLRWTSGIGTESFISTIGTANQHMEGNLSNAITPKGPFSVQPEDDPLTATAKSFLPNAAVEIALGGLVDVSGRAVGAGWNAATPNIAQRIRQGRVADRVKSARKWLEEAGIERRPDPSAGRWEFVDENPYEWEPSADTAPAPAPEAGPAAATPEPKPEYKPEPKPKPEPEPKKPAAPLTQQQAEDMLVGAEPEPIDFTAPEVETVVIAAEELGDEQLRALDASEGPVLDALEEQLQGVAYAERTSTPEGIALIANDVLAEPQVPFAEQWEQLPPGALLGVADPTVSPRIFQKVNDLTGKPYEEFTRKDVLDGLASLQADGLTLAPNRLQGEVMAVGDIKTDPDRFQYKQNVDKDGRQRGAVWMVSSNGIQTPKG